MNTKDAKKIKKALNAKKIVEIQFPATENKIPEVLILEEDDIEYDSEYSYYTEKCVNIETINFKSVNIICKLFKDVTKIFYYAPHQMAFDGKKNIIRDDMLYYIIKVDEEFDLDVFLQNKYDFCILV